MPEPRPIVPGERLGAYIDGELPPDERARLERELQADPSRYNELDAWRSYDEAFDEGEPPPVSSKAWRRLWKGVLRRTVGRPRLVRLRRWATGLAVAAGLGVAAASYSGLWTRLRPTAPDAAVRPPDPKKPSEKKLAEEPDEKPPVEAVGE